MRRQKCKVNVGAIASSLTFIRRTRQTTADVTRPLSARAGDLAGHVLRIRTSAVPKAAFTPDTCSRIQVSRTSNLYPDSSGYKLTCRRDDSFVADTGYDGDRRYKWIQVDTTCIRATCIRCKRGIMRLHLVDLSTCIPCRRLRVSCIGDKTVVTATLYPLVSAIKTLLRTCIRLHVHLNAT